MEERILKLSELRKWAKEGGYGDLWWFSVDGGKSDKPVKASLIPREGNVQVMNAGTVGTEKEEWILFRYPGYQTPEEKKRATELSELQKVALEFFGHTPDAFDRDSAKPVLDRCFSSEYDNDAYSEFKWKNRHRIYSRKEILERQYGRFRDRLFYVRETVPIEKQHAAVNAALGQGIDEDGLLGFLRRNHPDFLLAESTRKRKLREWREMHGHSTSGEERSGCLGVVLILLLPAFILIPLAMRGI